MSQDSRVMMQNGMYSNHSLTRELFIFIADQSVYQQQEKNQDWHWFHAVWLKLIEMWSEVYRRPPTTVSRKKQTTVGVFFFYEQLLSHKYQRNQINSTMIRITNDPHKRQHKTTRQTRPNKIPSQNLKENTSIPSTLKTWTTKLAKQGLGTKDRDESQCKAWRCGY